MLPRSRTVWHFGRKLKARNVVTDLYPYYYLNAPYIFPPDWYLVTLKTTQPHGMSFRADFLLPLCPKI